MSSGIDAESSLDIGNDKTVVPSDVKDKKEPDGFCINYYMLIIYNNEQWTYNPK